MFDIETLRELYAHMEWADARIWTAVRSLGREDDGLRDRLFHVHFTLHVFLQLWNGEEIRRRFATEFNGLEELHRWALPSYGRARELFATLSPARLVEPLPVPWSRLFEREIGRAACTATLAETMFQVTSHGAYHRGQINTRLRELGAEPPMVDYIAWVWLGKPAPEWPAPEHDA